MASLYQYGSVATMLNILNSQTIRLTDSFGLNDSTENKLVDEIASDELKAQGISSEDIEIYLAKFSRIKNVPFVACFSDVPDLLSQWRGYGDDGKGVSIGFNLEALKLPSSPPFQCIDEGPRFSLCKIEYLKSKQIRDDLKGSLEFWFKKVPDFKDSREGPTREIKVMATLKSAHIAALNKKLIAFAEERETRLVFVPDADKDGNIVNYTNEKRLQGPSFFVSGNKLRCYFDYSFKEKLVTEIWLGPKCEIKEPVLRSLLNSKGMNHVEIKRSSATYR